MQRRRGPFSTRTSRWMAVFVAMAVVVLLVLALDGRHRGSDKHADGHPSRQEEAQNHNDRPSNVEHQQQQADEGAHVKDGTEGTANVVTATPFPARPPGQYAVMHLDAGDITIALAEKAAPLSVANFVRLSRNGFFNASTFYRYEKNFVLQGGVWGVPRHESPTVPLEYNLPNVKHSIAFARTSDPNSGGTEFFINLVDSTEHLGVKQGGGYAVFGHVIAGFETMNALMKLPTKAAGLTYFVEPRPVIHSISIVLGAPIAE